MFDVSPTAGMIVGNVGVKSPRVLFLEVCAANDVLPNLIRGPRRDARMVAVRRNAARVLHGAGCSLPEIGRLLGGRHHTTVMNLLDPDWQRQRVAARKERNASRR